MTAVKFYLESARCDVNEPGPDGTTALCAASLWGNDPMVRFLIDNGASVNARNTGTTRARPPS
jgi:ankyrin repeat protein